MFENQHNNNNNLDGQLLNRGCELTKEYAPGQKVLSCGRCKLNQFDWLKDYENQEVQGNVCLAEVRFKNDRKDYFTYPEDLELEVGELVAVEAAIGHDIGIVTMLGESCCTRATPVVTDWKSLIQEAQHNSRPHEPMPPSLADSCRTPI